MAGTSHLLIDRLWDGEQGWASERSEVFFTLEANTLAVEIKAGFHGDPAPNLAAGRADGLWNYEVIELFLANAAGHYLELEFGPHGHYLALQFSEIRRPNPLLIPMSFQTEISAATWRGTAKIAVSYLPSQLCLANAYAIHGQGQNRRYLAAFPVPGPRPDFHQPQFFKPF